MVWNCAKCKLTHDDSIHRCTACKAKPKKDQLSIGKLTCVSCSHLNKDSRTNCKACGTKLIPFLASNDQTTVIDLGSSDSDGADSVDRNYDLVDKNFADYTTVEGQMFRCNFDGKTCKNRSMMIAYVIRYHPEKLVHQNIKTNNSGTTESVVELSDDDDDSENNGTMANEKAYVENNQIKKEKYRVIDLGKNDSIIHLTLSNSQKKSQKNRNDFEKYKRSTMNKTRKTNQDSLLIKKPKKSLKPNNTNKTDNFIEVSDEKMKNIRLEKLLLKTDKFVKGVMENMNKMVETTKTLTLENDGIEVLNPISTGEVETNEIFYKFSGFKLRDYQVGGIEWLCSLYLNGLNGILADEMGLGKTVQIIGFLCLLYERFGLIGPHLVLLPLSVLNSWKTDISRFAGDKIEVYIHHGVKESREEGFYSWLRKLRKEKNDSHENGINRGRRKVWVVLTTYEIALKDEYLLKKVNLLKSCRWEYLVVDEAHRLKNSSSQLYESLNSLRIKNRVLLTGTPLQNNLNELWSLLSFILPNLFNDKEQFSEWFNKPFESETESENEKTENETEKSDSKKMKKRKRKCYRSISNSSNLSNLLTEHEKKTIITSLHRAIKPFVLRRIKSQVIAQNELPPKVEKMVLCPMSSLQLKIHELIKNTILTQENNEKQENFKNFLNCGNSGNLLMQLRKLNNHPYLVLEDLKSIPDGIYDKFLLSCSGKMFVLDKILRKLLKNGSKVLIFSQMTTMLTILQGYLLHQGIPCLRLDGNTNSDSREKQLSIFNNSPKEPSPEDSVGGEDSLANVFLLSTRAGGVGINLQAADSVVLFDSDWNPQQDLQAISRAHRLGQSKTVLVLRLVTAGPDENTASVEQHILFRATKKLFANRQILVDGHFSMGTTNSNLSDSNSNLADMDLFNTIRERENNSVDMKGLKGESRDSGVLEVNENDSEQNEILLEFLSKNMQNTKFDFSDDFIDKICLRENSEVSAQDTVYKKKTENKTEIFEFYLSENETFFPMKNDLMNSSKDLKDFKPWLEPNIESKNADNNIENPDLDGLNKENCSDIQIRPLRRKEKKNLNEDNIWKQVVKEAEEFKISPKPKKKSKNNSLTLKAHSKENSSEHSEESSSESSFLEENDICTICGQAWISEEDFEHLKKNKEKTSVSESVSNSSNGELNDLENTMIICDACEGSFHMLCVGLEKVPEEDWFCQLCNDMSLL